MRGRPLLLIVCSLLFLYFPFEAGVSAGRGQQLGVAGFLMDFVMPVACLAGLLRVTRVGWYSLVAFISLWGVRDLQIYYAQSGGTNTALFLHVLIYAVSLAYFINPRVRRLYFDPRQRWWRTKPRYETHLPVILRDTGWRYHVLRNISDGGCFVETNAPLSVNERFRILLPLPVPLSCSVIQTEGEVRWVSSDPKKTGMGVQFLAPDAPHRRAIREMVRMQL